MRTIKFRAWDGHNMIHAQQREHDGILIGFKGNTFDLLDGEIIVAAGLELMQFTGLQDKNGKDIYESDILHFGDKNIKYTVVWHDCGLVCRQNSSSSSYAGIEHWEKHAEVIGTLYENPDLLK